MSERREHAPGRPAPPANNSKNSQVVPREARLLGAREALLRRAPSAAGFSLVEVMVSVGIMTAIMAATMSALSQAMKANETAVLVTGMNNTLRTGMDLMIRDLLQVGSGLPPGHFVLIPSPGTQINIPGPPGTSFLTVVGDTELNAVNPGTGFGPVVTGNATDTITTLAADSTFTHVGLTARSANGATPVTITVDAAVNIGTGPDRVVAGQLILLEKGSYSVLLQVTSVNAGAHLITFAGSDSLNLNQHAATTGSVNGVNGLNAFAPSPDTALPSPQTVPATPFLATVATRVRMITYYIDATIAAHPKLVRRINNGHPTVFDNASGSTVAFDIDNLQISYDIANGGTNPANVKFTTADYAGTGKCAPDACSVNQIRKVNITLGARSRSVFSSTRQYFRNALTTQVSLRGMSFVNDYVQ